MIDFTLIMSARKEHTASTIIDSISEPRRQMREQLTAMQDWAGHSLSAFIPGHKELNLSSHEFRGRVGKDEDRRSVTFLLPRRDRKGVVRVRFIDPSRPEPQRVVDVDAFENFGSERIAASPVYRDQPFLPDEAREVIDGLEAFLVQNGLKTQIQVRQKPQYPGQKPAWKDFEQPIIS